MIRPRDRSRRRAVSGRCGGKTEAPARVLVDTRVRRRRDLRPGRRPQLGRSRPSGADRAGPEHFVQGTSTTHAKEPRTNNQPISPPSIRRPWSKKSGRGQAEWGPTLLVVGGWASLHPALCLFWPRNRISLVFLADAARGGNGGGRPVLPDLDHSRAAGSDHSRTSPPRLLWCTLAPPPPLPADVVAAQHGGPGLDGVRVVRGFQGVLERSPGHACAAATPAR